MSVRESNWYEIEEVCRDKVNELRKLPLLQNRNYRKWCAIEEVCRKKLIQIKRLPPPKGYYNGFLRKYSTYKRDGSRYSKPKRLEEKEQVVEFDEDF